LLLLLLLAGFFRHRVFGHLDLDKKRGWFVFGGSTVRFRLKTGIEGEKFNALDSI
jgi:hypothetical protein